MKCSFEFFCLQKFYVAFDYQRCNIISDPKVCDCDVCLNGGNCVPVDSGRHFICQCSPGFRGMNRSSFSLVNSKEIL